MGNSQQLHNLNLNINSHVIANTKFIQNMDDQNFGNIDIYKNQQGKYIMMLRRTFMKQGVSKQKSTQSPNSQYKDFGFLSILHALEQSQSQSNPSPNSLNLLTYLTPILHTVSKTQNLCISYLSLETYSQYYNFTLLDLIKYKKQLEKQELFFIVKWMVQFAIVLKERGWEVSGGLGLGRVFVTLKGEMNVSVHFLGRGDQGEQVWDDGVGTAGIGGIGAFGGFGKRDYIEDIGYGVLQLACMNVIKIGDSNLELYLRKVKKISPYLGQILASMLKKSISSKNSKKPTLQQILQKIQQLVSQQKINISKQIKLNKFKYVLPKPQIKSQNLLEPAIQSHSNENNTSTTNTSNNNNSKRLQSEKSDKKQQKPITINSLHGRKNRQNQSLKNSNKRQNLDFHVGPLSSLPCQTPSNALSNTIGLGLSPLTPQNFQQFGGFGFGPSQTPLNKTLSIKSALLMDQIQSRKKQTERQKQKLSERKQMIMNMSNGMSKNGKNNTNNKQNLLGNSIRQVRPSYSSQYSKSNPFGASNQKTPGLNFSLGSNLGSLLPNSIPQSNSHSQSQSKQILALSNPTIPLKQKQKQKQKESWTKKIITQHLKKSNHR